MSIFKRKEDDISEEEFDQPEKTKKIRDLKPDNRRARKEVVKPWGKKERLLVFLTLFVTILISGGLALSARSYKLPNLPELSPSLILSLNPFRERVLVVDNVGNLTDIKKIEQSKNEFKSLTDKYSGIYAYYIHDLNGDYFYGLNYSQQMQAASLIKLPLMVMALQKVENGEVSKDEFLPLIRAMGKSSDNNAFLKVLDLLGRDSFKKTITDFGMTQTDYDKNLTTAQDIGILLKKIHRNDLLGQEMTDFLIDSLIDTEFESWLRKGVPEEYRLAHKYGREVHVVNDAGIIYTDKPFIIVIMSDGVVEKEADSIFPDIAGILYKNHVE